MTDIRRASLGLSPRRSFRGVFSPRRAGKSGRYGDGWFRVVLIGPGAVAGVRLVVLVLVFEGERDRRREGRLRSVSARRRLFLSTVAEGVLHDSQSLLAREEFPLAAVDTTGQLPSLLRGMIRSPLHRSVGKLPTRLPRNDPYFFLCTASCWLLQCSLDAMLWPPRGGAALFAQREGCEG